MEYQGHNHAVEIVLDTSGLVLSISAAEGSQRLVSDVAEGEALHGHIHPDDYDFFLWCAQWVLNGAERRRTIPLRWARAGGRWARIDVTLSGASDETVMLTLTPDEAEQARRAEAQLRRIVEGSAQGVVIRTATKVLFANDSFAHLIGYASQKEMAEDADLAIADNRDPHLINSVHPDDRALVSEHMRRRLAGEETVSNYEFRLTRRDGSTVWVDARAALVQWDGQPASLSWMSDITARKAMETELIRSTEAAELANRTKTEFLANMSHELRTPLNAIIGFAEVIKDEMFGPVGLRKYAEYARDIHSSGRHLLDLINDILDLSKLESGKLALRQDVVVPAAVVEECLVLIRNRAQTSGVALSTQIAPDLPKLLCDERAVKQVLLNFLSNAIKFTPPGGSVTTGAAASEGGLSIWVRDTGIGMSESDVEVALSAFGQVDSKIARQHHGTGLGLPISKQLIEAHGGTLTIESEPGIGTTMIATFPASRMAREAA